MIENIALQKGKPISSKRPLVLDENVFHNLISPKSFQRFEKEYWEQKPLVIKRKGSDFYKNLFSLDLVDKVLDLSKPTGGSIRVVKDQKPMLKQKYENGDGNLGLNQIYAAYADGYTIVINEIDRFWSPIKSFCRFFSTELSHHSVANMYLTPRNEVALAPHYDTHDVYVLQIHGKKHWNLYDPVNITPTMNSHQPIFNEKDLYNQQQVTLEAGDFMYMPRGIPHHAYTSDKSSLHLTIGVYPPQWSDLLINSIKAKSYNVLDLRQSLPLGYLKDDQAKDQVLSRAKELIKSHTAELNLNQGVFMLSEELRTQFILPADGHFENLDILEEINCNTVLEKRTHSFSYVLNKGGEARILYPGNIVKGPYQVSSAFEFISNTQSFAVYELPIELDEHKITIAKKLVRGGLLKMKQEFN